MNTPQRIQLQRTKGWRKPEGAIVVARPSKWGNPIRIDRERLDHRWMWRVHGSPMDHHDGPAYNDRDTARFFAVRFFKWDLLNGRYGDSYPSLDQIVAELAGKDLACWCPIRRYPNGGIRWGLCHADVLLEIANREQS
jgi:hypothetical protein